MMFTGACIVVGVTSCGKTSVGAALAQRLGCAFIEGDALHPAANIAKMSRGDALTDDDRWPWLDSIGAALKAELDTGRGVIASCSALKRGYRLRLMQAAGRPLVLVFLDGDPALLAARIASRRGHFMPPSLLDSQLKTLERPGGDEAALRLDISQPVPALVDSAAAYLSHG
jgi:gluconokinase